MSKIDPVQLSSNWKKLQEKLGSEKKSQSSTGVKRKRTAEQKNERNAINTGNLKKQKIERLPQKSGLHKSKRMGNSFSNPANKQTNISNENMNAVKSTSGTSGSAVQSVVDTPVDEHRDVTNSGLVPNRKVGKYVALDCEMVGTGPPPFLDHVLARASLVNFHGEQIYDSYVLPPPRITIGDYRTHVSGITPEHLRSGYARTFQEVQAEVTALVEGRMLVGHALKNDLQVLELNHPKRDLRDTSRHPKYRIKSRGKTPALRDLARDELGLKIHGGAHSSIEDARVAMALFKKEKPGFEEENRKYYGPSRRMNGNEQRQALSHSMTEEGLIAGDNNDEEEDDEDEGMDLMEDEDEDDKKVAIQAAEIPRSTTTKAKKKKKKKSRTKRS